MCDHPEEPVLLVVSTTRMKQKHVCKFCGEVKPSTSWICYYEDHIRVEEDPTEPYPRICQECLEYYNKCADCPRDKLGYGNSGWFRVLHRKPALQARRASATSFKKTKK